MSAVLSPKVLPILMLVASNVFMTFAWYGHLKHKGSALYAAVMVSWGIAFFEYWLAVPANRIGSAVYSTAELKTIQEVITLTVFVVFPCSISRKHSPGIILSDSHSSQRARRLFSGRERFRRRSAIRKVPMRSSQIGETEEASMRARRIPHLISAIVLGLSAPAFAAGGGGSSDAATKCKKGMVWDKVQKKCVVPKQGALGDDSIFEAGRALAYAARYDEAITVLSLAANKADPRILNFLGYSHRKQGRISVGLGYYEEALRIDPDYTLVREYLGEAHLQRGDLAAAEEQLAEIAKRCGTACTEYAELAAEIRSFKEKNG